MRRVRVGCLIGVLTALLWASAPAFGQIPQQGESSASDFYVAGPTVAIPGDIAGDLVTAGGSVFVGGAVKEDVIAAGGTVTVAGPVADDIRALGGIINLNDTVDGDVLVIGGQINLLSGARVNGNFFAAGGKIVIEGEVGGRLRAVGGEIIVNDKIGGPAELAGNKITLGPKTEINGNLSYSAPEPAAISPQARVLGQTLFQQTKIRSFANGDRQQGLLGLWGLWQTFKFLLLLTAALAGVLLFRQKSTALVRNTIAFFGRELVRGLIILIVFPIAMLILVASIIAIPLGALGFLLYFAFLLVAQIYAGVLLGAWLGTIIFHHAEPLVNWKTAASGTAALAIIQMVPWVGWIANLILLLAVFGALFHHAYRAWWLEP